MNRIGYHFLSLSRCSGYIYLGWIAISPHIKAAGQETEIVAIWTSHAWHIPEKTSAGTGELIVAILDIRFRAHRPTMGSWIVDKNEIMSLITGMSISEQRDCWEKMTFSGTDTGAGHVELSGVARWTSGKHERDQCGMARSDDKFNSKLAHCVTKVKRHQKLNIKC